MAAAFGVGVSLASVPSAKAEFFGSRPDEQHPNRLLVITDPNTLEPSRFREFSGRIIHSEPSPNGRYVGVTIVDPASKKGGLFSFVLHVMDERSRTVASAKNAQAFKFSPDDRFVAIIRGKPFEGATGFLPEATEIVDLQSQERWTVPQLKEAIAVDWRRPPDEGLTLVARLPTACRKVWKYHMASRRCEATSWKGIHFSPDGKFYYLTPEESIEAGLCRPGTRKDSCIRAFSWQNEAVKLNLQQRVRRLVGWSKRTGHVLLVTTRSEGQLVDKEVDLATGRVNTLKEPTDRRWTARPGLRLTRLPSGRLDLRLNR